MPEDKKGFVDIKLSSGYNIGLDKKKIKKIELISKKKNSAIVKKKTLTKNDLSNISILHTGGTIASKVDYETGGVIASFTTDELLQLMPELKALANINSVFVSNMMSEDMRFSDYKKIAKIVKEEILKGTDGIIIGHGTDTIAITSAALAFMLKDVPVPVIMVGSQRSSDRGSSDAAMNLICASAFISSTDFKGVAVCMHEETSDTSCLILPATKTRKMHTSRRDAFKSVNDTAIARVNYDTKDIELFKEFDSKKRNFQVLDKFEEKVAIIRTHVNMSSDLIDTLIEKGYKGLILEATGIGQAPTNVKENMPIYNSLKKFISKGGIVGLTSQCIFGRVHKDIYANCRRLAEIGVIFCEDMLTDTAYVKLAWLLGTYPKEAKELLAKNLVGEITDRTEEDTFM